MSKYALQNEVSSATILNDVNTTLETRALARLADHKFILDAVQSFRNKYSDWKLCITELLSELGIKYRGKKKPNEKKMVKRKIEVKSEILKKNVKRNTDTEEFENVQSLSIDVQSNSEDDNRNVGYESNSNELDVTLEETQTETKIEKIHNNFSKEELNYVISSKTIIKEKNIDLNKDNKNVKPSKVGENILEIQLPEKKSNFLTNKVADDVDIERIEQPLKRKAEHSITSTVGYKKRIVLDEIKPVCETVDSFFMTADDKDYMSVYKPPPVTPIAEGNVKRSKLDYQKPTNEIFIKGKKVTFGKQNNSIGNRRERRQQQVEEPVDTVLHPSWEAKRKQKSLAKFEGKKITFNDKD